MKILERKVAYVCPIFKVEERRVLLDSGKEKIFYVIVRAPNVSVIALTNDQKIVLIKEIIGDDRRECLALPSGKVDNYISNEEEVKKQALTELREESGYTAEKIEFLCKDDHPWTTIDRDYYRYVAWNLTFVGQDLEDGENITPYLVSVKEAEEIIKERKMTSADEEKALIRAINFFKENQLI